jgi:hypothetical protein
MLYSLYTILYETQKCTGILCSTERIRVRASTGIIPPLTGRRTPGGLRYPKTLEHVEGAYKGSKGARGRATVGDVE